MSARRLLETVRNDRISDRALAALVFLPVLSCYLASGHWALSGSDATAAAWPAWALVHHGTLHLEGFRDLLPPNAWFIAGAHGHLVSSRMPGVIFIGVPAQAVFAWTGWDPVTSSVVTAAVVSSGAVAIATLLFRRLSNAAAALVAGGVLAFGTTLWTVAGTELWTHGPDVLWLGAGLLALSAGRTVWSGVLLAPAVATRPHVVIAVAAIAAVVAWQRRSVRVLPALAVPAAIALFSVVAFNWYQFGTATLSGGVYSYAGHAAIVGSGGSFIGSMRDWASMSAAFLVSPMRGVLPYSPVVLVSLIGLKGSWRRLPDWGRGAAIGGVLYLLVQARINGIYSSFGFFGYRLTIESVLLWSPLVFVAARELWASGRRLIVFLLAASSIAIQLCGAAFGRVIAVSVNADPWRTWLPIELMKNGGPKVIVISLLAAGLVVLVGIRVLSSPQRGRQQQVSDAARAPVRTDAPQPSAPMFNRSARGGSRQAATSDLTD